MRKDMVSTKNFLSIVIAVVILVVGCKGNKSTVGGSASSIRRTFIMIHLEAGYKACKVADNLPPGLSADVCSQGWQNYFWPTLVDLVAKADEYGYKLTLAFTPEWGQLIANDSARCNLVQQWKSNGHEIGFHHHAFTHPDWDGYSNEPAVQGPPPDPLYLGPVNDGFSYVSALTAPDNIISSTLSGTVADYPSQMNSPTVIFGVGNQYDSYPQFGSVQSLQPVMIHTADRDIVQLPMREFSMAMDITPEEAMPILQDQYRNLQDNEVFGIVWHEYDYYLGKDWYIQWFEFIKANGNSVKTMYEIGSKYFK